MKLSILLASVPFFLFGCQKKEIHEIVSNDDVAIVWQNLTDFAYLSEDSREGKTVLNAAKKSHSYKDYNLRFSLGNLAVIEGRTPASQFVMDGVGKHGYIGVLMGENTQLVKLPSSILVSQFMTAIRPNPEKMKLSERCQVLSVLGGFQSPLFASDMRSGHAVKNLSAEPRDPEWRDENGVLNISYYAYRSTGNMTAPELVLCRIKVDSNQEIESVCEPVEVYEKSEI